MARFDAQKARAMVLRDPEAKRKAVHRDGMPLLRNLLRGAAEKYRGVFYSASCTHLGFPDGSVLVARLNQDYVWEKSEIAGRLFYWEFRAYGL